MQFSKALDNSRTLRAEGLQNYEFYIKLKNIIRKHGIQWLEDPLLTQASKPYQFSPFLILCPYRFNLFYTLTALRPFATTCWSFYVSFRSKICNVWVLYS
jgi:hypothetical protein